MVKYEIIKELLGMKYWWKIKNMLLIFMIFYIFWQKTTKSLLFTILNGPKYIRCISETSKSNFFGWVRPDFVGYTLSKTWKSVRLLTWALLEVKFTKIRISNGELNSLKKTGMDELNVKKTSVCTWTLWPRVTCMITTLYLERV